MQRPSFTIEPVGGNCFTINEGGRTVALISSQGYIDWLLTTPAQEGPLITEIVKETHLCYTLGLKLLLTTPHPATEMTVFDGRVEDDGARVVLVGESASADGAFAARTTAVLAPDAAGRAYAWEMETILTCTADAPVALPGVEYNNVYPGRTGRCMMFAATKEYRYTLMTDRDGMAWRFPHQHLLHYHHHIQPLCFAPGTLAGFFGDPAPASGYPVVRVLESPLEPTWGICDMYYDLHCCAHAPAPMPPGAAWRFAYRIGYLDAAEAHALLEASRPVPVTLDHWATHDYPRLELGLNRFTRGCDIDRPDDCCGFRPAPPRKVWDREAGHGEKGALRLMNPAPEELVWSAEPPTQVPAESVLRITGLVKTEGVAGKGMFIRVRYHTYVWHPTPHVEWYPVLESAPVNGTTDGWVQVRVPELRVPKEQFDYLVWIDVVLDGAGTAWLTDVDIELTDVSPALPEIEEGGLKKKTALRTRSRTRSGAGPVH